MQKPEVDVIIPCFNAEKYVEETIASVLAQNYSNINLIIVDDGSKDSSYESILRATKTCARKTILRTSNLGLASARNLGLGKSKASYVAFLDADDIWAPNKVAKQVKFLEDNPKFVGVCSNFGIFGTNTPLQINRRKNSEINTLNLLSRRAFVPGSASSIMIRRDMLNSDVKFDLNLTYAEDLDFWIQLSKIGPIWSLPSTDVFIRVHAVSMQSTFFRKPHTIGTNLMSIINKNRSELSSIQYISYSIDVTTNYFIGLIKLIFVERSLNGVLDSILEYFTKIGTLKRILLLLAIPFGISRKFAFKCRNKFSNFLR